MKKFNIFALLFFQGLIAFAQPAALGNTGRIDLVNSDERFQFVNPYDGRYKELVGERYFYDSLYRTGELKTAKHLYKEDLTYRFDQIERTIQVKMPNGKEVFLFESDIEYCKIVIEGKTIVFIPETVPNGRKKATMLQVIYKSPTMQLYRDVRKFIFRVKSENIDGYSSEKVYDEIRKDYHYYFRKGSHGAFKEIKIDAKSFAEVLPNKRAKVAQLFREGQAKGGLTVTKIADILTALDTEDKPKDADVK